jgi:esterase
MGKGDPILILHGLFGNSDNWLPIARRLADDHLIYLADMRNHGKSPVDPVFTLDAMVEDVYEFINDLGLRTISLIGHSMGGMVAMNFAMEYAHRVDRMAIIDIAPRPYPVLHDDILRYLLELDLATLKSRHDADMRLSRRIPSRAVRQFLLKSLYRAEDGRYKWHLNLPVIKKNLSEIRKGIMKPHRTDIPVLFIRGEKSEYLKDTDAVQIPEIFSNARVETIQNASHWVHSEAPDEVYTCLKEFFTMETPS